MQCGQSLVLGRSWVCSGHGEQVVWPEGKVARGEAGHGIGVKWCQVLMQVFGAHWRG